MFLDHDLRNIQAAKERLATCCALRRRLAQIEVQELGSGLRRSLSNLNVYLAVIEQLFHLWRGRKDRHGSSGP